MKEKGFGGSGREMTGGNGSNYGKNVLSVSMVLLKNECNVSLKWHPRSQHPEGRPALYLHPSTVSKPSLCPGKFP